MLTFKKFPDTLLILLGILIFFVAMTWIIPAGEFEREMVNGRSVVIPGSYHAVEAAPQGMGALLLAPIRGFVGAASIIAFVFLVGGSFAIVTKTGAIDAGLQNIILSNQNRPSSKKWIVAILMILFSLAGATFGMSEEVLVFVLITIPLAIALGYDSIVGIAISFVGAGVGFAGAFLNPFTIGIAQGIAELVPFSGIEYRLFTWLIMTAVAIIFVLFYISKIEQSPQRSPVYDIDQRRNLSKLSSVDKIEFTSRRKMVIGLLFLALITLTIGASRYGWYINEITGLFIALGVLSAIVAGLSAESAVAAFKEGAKEMLTPVLVIALAKGLIVVASDGKIIDTILQGISTTTEGLPKVVSVEIMFVLQSFLNFFVPSGSGQAALTMPIMAPLSDLLGVGRQTAVLAFQFGDGLSNLIIPTSGITMGILAIADIPYDKWLKWMLPLFLILTLTAMILLAIPVFFAVW